MMPPEPLRSAMTAGCAEDTSLALPSDNKLRSGHQRVMDQVHTIKRSKSKQGRNGPLSPSPTTLAPQHLSTYTEFGTFKFTPAKSNGYYSRSGSSAYSKSGNSQKSRTLSLKTAGARNYSTSATWDQQINTASRSLGLNGLKSSRSDPALAPPFTPAPVPGPVMRAKGQTVQSQSVFQSQSRVNRHSTYSMTDGNIQQATSQTRIMRPPSTLSTNEGKMGTIKTSKIEQKSAVNVSAGVSDLTLKEAVDYLSNPEEKYQQCGATFIQHSTYSDDSTKPEVFQLGGIPALVTLLRSSSPGVSQAAAGALRNLVFKDHHNKLEVQHCGGVAKALQLLKETDSTETQKQITGLLWNLSSADELKEELIATALPALTENVVVPFTSWSESATNNHIDPQVFYCATGCLRNLSSGHRSERQAMRSCPGLVDALMSYVQSCVAEENPDDKSVENCACILHNLTFQLEDESPLSFSDINPQNAAPAGNAKNSTVGCFSPKSSKAQKEFSYDVARALPKIDSPSGVKWLCHPKAMETYLSLLGSSQKDATLEACCGALQNLTASKGLGSSAVSQFLVQKFKAPLQMASLLKSSNPTLQKTAISLLSNMSRTNGLQKAMSKQIVPELASLLSSGPGKMPDATVATACNTARKLILADPEVGKKVITSDLIYSLVDLSENKSSPKASTGAATLLYSLWGDKNIQGIIKKLGIDKSVFVNDATTAAHQSVQVID
ncbi:plakophilin-1 [Salarias fasciatus]|uniref:Plakophilin 1 n=1 Tax=Salarias fasciatus TaxID=181472 RepID=A0A672H2Z0_SALFA|nr:plakophilin-1 [Salarias fasciatus]